MAFCFYCHLMDVLFSISILHHLFSRAKERKKSFLDRMKRSSFFSSSFHKTVAPFVVPTDFDNNPLAMNTSNNKIHAFYSPGRLVVSTYCYLMNRLTCSTHFSINAANTDPCTFNLTRKFFFALPFSFCDEAKKSVENVWWKKEVNYVKCHTHIEITDSFIHF